MAAGAVRRPLAAVCAVLVGLLAGFFLVFNALFADGSQDPLDPEYLLAYTLIFLVYGGAAYATARWGRWGAWAVLWLAPPAALVVVAYQDPAWPLRLLVGAAVALGLAVGILLARRATTAGSETA